MKIEDLNEGIHDPHTYKALFIVGGPGSGKTFVGKKLSGGTGLVSINLDDFNEMFMKQMKINDPSYYKDKASYFKDKKKDLVTNEGLGLIIDGTGRNYSKIEKNYNKLKSLGYDSAMVFVNTDIEISLERNETRFRTVDNNILLNAHHEVRSNLGKFQKLFDSNKFFVIDNTSEKTFKEQFDNVWKNVQKFLKG